MKKLVNNNKASLNINNSLFLNKKAQGMSTSTIVLLILAVVVLVVLILGFTMGWGKLAPFIKSTNNVNDVKQGCEVACATNAEYDFCTVKRELKSEDSNLKDVTCNYLSVKQSLYGISRCDSVNCQQILSDTNNEDNARADCVNAGDFVQYLEGDTLKTITCE
jgi:hypothetical protein